MGKGAGDPAAAHTHTRGQQTEADDPLSRGGEAPKGHALHRAWEREMRERKRAKGRQAVGRPVWETWGGRRAVDVRTISRARHATYPQPGVAEDTCRAKGERRGADTKEMEPEE
jgi:hypothetical protein